MNSKGPKGFHGHTTWTVRYNFQSGRDADSRCVVSVVTPVLAAEIVLPRWMPGSSVTAEQRRNWELYSERLKLHEDGHVAHGRQAAEALAKMAGMRGDCGSIDSNFKQRAEEVLRRYSAMDVEYDKTTNHGATQGAQLPR
jgi:predicted secreted Zn-dependent protease